MKRFQLHLWALLMALVTLAFDTQAQTFIPNFNAGTGGTNFTQLLARPVGLRNNIGHLEEGIYGRVNLNNTKWIGIGSAPGTVGVPVYGTRMQWDQNFVVFNLLETSLTQKDVVMQWGGTAANNRFLFRYTNNPSTTVGTTYMQIESNGNVGIGITPSVNDRLRVNGRIRFGSAEYFEDGGANTITSQGSLVPVSNGSRDLGTAALRWRTVFATNGTIQTSDKRDKDNINNMEYGLKELMKLRPVTYVWKDRPEEGVQMGLIAQEVNKVMNEVVYDPATTVVKDEEGNLVTTKSLDDNARMGISYTSLIPVLIKSIQEQQGNIKKQRETIRSQRAEIRKLKRQMRTVMKELDIKAGSITEKSLGQLFQNIPNPSDKGTQIGYVLDQKVSQATIQVYDLNGELVKTIALNNRGSKSNVNLAANALKPSIYTYVLIADGQVVDTKRMIVR